MRITEQKEFETLFRQRSVIINRPPNDPHKRPRFMQAYDFSRRGLEQQLFERLNEETGSLAAYRDEVKQHLESWNRYAKLQVKRPKEPIGQWSENLNRARARVKVCEEECRILHKALDEALAKEAAQAAAIHRHARGALKWRDGKPYSCDGRMLTVDGEGTARFKDDGSPLDTYLDALKASSKAKIVAKKTADRERQERVNQARGITTKRRRTPLRARG